MLETGTPQTSLSARTVIPCIIVRTISLCGMTEVLPLHPTYYVMPLLSPCASIVTMGQTLMPLMSLLLLIMCLTLQEAFLPKQAERQPPPVITLPCHLLSLRQEETILLS